MIPFSPAALSIIVPTFNEAGVVAGALRRLARQAPQAERIVVDGGSSDGTVELARPLARVIQSARGRASQLNLGAKESRGEWLLFLHADTALPDDFLDEMARAAERGRDAGAFRLRIAGRHRLLPLLAWGANLRTRWRGIALGDQALFCTRSLFTGRGGFPPVSMLEDYLFTLGLKQAGVPLYLTRSVVTTSGRRWDQGRFWRTWWQFRMIYWRFRQGAEWSRPGSQGGRGYEDVR
ncbi:MAG: TIGR04283 family arsenosugar biosynthesis glycosyltransferase [bacterium]